MTIDEAAIRLFYGMLGHQSLGTTELRAIRTESDGSSHVIGQTWVRNVDQLILFCRRYNGQANIYAGVNPRKGKGTSLNDITHITVIPLDVDAEYPDRKIQPATNDEIQEAFQWAKKVHGYITGDEWKAQGTGFAMSGNGIQIPIPIKPIPLEGGNREEIQAKFEEFQRILIRKFPEAKIDPVGDLPRIIKVIGTQSVKPKPIKDRPNRISKWIKKPSREYGNETLVQKILSIEPLEQAAPPEEQAPITDQELAAILKAAPPRIRDYIQHGKAVGHRSEPDYGLVIWLIKREVPKSRIAKILRSIPGSKAAQVSDQYFEHTYNKAWNVVQKEKQERQEKQEKEKEERSDNPDELLANIVSSGEEDQPVHPSIDYHREWGPIFGTKVVGPRKSDLYYCLVTPTKRHLYRFVVEKDDKGKVTGESYWAPIDTELTWNQSLRTREIERDLAAAVTNQSENNPTDAYHAIRDVIEKKVWLSEPVLYDIVTCWVLGTYLFPMFMTYPYLWLTGMKNTGKSKLEAVLKLLCFNGKKLVNPTEATIFRTIQNERPTYIIDESRGIFGSEVFPAIEAILNAGYKNDGTKVPRCVGDSNEVEEFDVYGPKVIAGLNRISDVLEDRSIAMVMEEPDDVNIQDEEIDPRVSMFREARQKAFSFALSHYKDVREAYDMLKRFTHLHGRNRELWLPLLAICECVNPSERSSLEKKALELKRSRDSQDLTSTIEVGILEWLMELVGGTKKEDEKLLKVSLMRIHAKMVERYGGRENAPKWLTWQRVQQGLRNLNIINKKGKDDENHVAYYLDPVRIRKRAKKRGIDSEIDLSPEDYGQTELLPVQTPATPIATPDPEEEAEKARRLEELKDKIWLYCETEEHAPSEIYARFGDKYGTLLVGRVIGELEHDGWLASHRHPNLLSQKKGGALPSGKPVAGGDTD